jgi:predicted metal-dependent hydrolase
VCHLAHLHHGPAFHQLVADVYPEHALADAILDAWTHVLYQEPFTP